MRVRVATAGGLLALTALVGALAGCGAHSASNAGVEVECVVAPSPPAVGDAIVTVTLAGRDRAPVTGATVKVEGNMSHAGMEPVFADAREVAPGRYEAPLAFTMAGDWVLSVDATLAGGTSVRREVPVRGVRAR